MLRFLYCFLVIVLSNSALAQDKGQKTQGWTPKASVSLNAAISSANHVVGQTDGTGQTYGTALTSDYNYQFESMEWLNKLQFSGATSRAADSSRFVKTNDNLQFDSVYLYALPNAPQFGPYVRLSAASPIFAGEDVRAKPVLYRITHNDGSEETRTDSVLQLTEAFKPLTTKESLGFSWKPQDRPSLRLETRLGVGAQQIFAQNQFTVAKTNSDGSVEIKELNSVRQLGAEAGVFVRGEIDQNSAWEVGVESLVPFVNNKPKEDRRNAWQLANFDGHAKFTSKISSWASVSYDYKVILRPQLTERAQETHLFVFNVNYNLF